jgi:hypothetical protein
MFSYLKVLITATAILFSSSLISTNASSTNSQNETNGDLNSQTDSQANPQNKVVIAWHEPQKFRDVKHPTMSRKRYRESVFKELESYFEELTEALPDGQVLNINVTELDLAGTVQTQSMAGLSLYSQNSFSDMNEYRIMRNIDIPRMTFSYTLKDEKGQLIQQDEVALKDLNYLTRVNTIRKSTSLRYEKSMISSWFEKTFSTET